MAEMTTSGPLLQFSDSARAEEDYNHSWSPEDRACFFLRYTFWWAYPTIRKARRSGHLHRDDLPGLPIADQPQLVFDRFSRAWSKQLQRAPSLLRVLLWTSQRQLCFSAILHRWIGLFCIIVDPILLHALLQQTGESANLRFGLLVVVAQTTSLLCRVSVSEVAWHRSTRTMNNARSVAVHSVFRRCLLSSPFERKHDIGTLTNFMATDADKFGKNDGLIYFIAQWFWSVLSLPVVIFFLAQLVGITVVGLVVMIVSSAFCLNKFLMTCTKPLVHQLQIKRDERSRLMNELVRGIRVIKLEVLEGVWQKRINIVREKEMRLLVKIQILNALNSLVGNLFSLAIPSAVFAWHVLVDREVLTSTTAFVTLQWLAVLQDALYTLPSAYSQYAYMIPSMRRLKIFLTPEDAGPPESSDRDESSRVWLNPRLGECKIHNVLPCQPAIVMEGVSLGYRCIGGEASSDERLGFKDMPVLTNLNLSINPGEFVLVTGTVGSGKSTLLTALSGAQSPMMGDIRIHGQRAFAAQKPFLLNCSLRDNILFMREFDSELYDDVIRRTALLPDLQTLAQGDATIVGENGVQLSGGQKARVALARVLYSRADIVVCDDVLSAVDAHTAKYLWDEVFVGGLVAQGRTAVLATHQVQYFSCPEVSRIVALHLNTIWKQCPWKELPESARVVLASETKAKDLVDSWSEGGEIIDVSPSTDDGICRGTFSEQSVATERVHLDLEEIESAISNLLQPLEGRRVNSALIQDVLAGLRGQREDRSREGVIAWVDFKVYLRAFGSAPTIVLLVVIAILVAAMSVAGNAWLSLWAESGDPDKQRWYLSVYVGIGLSSGLIIMIESCTLTLSALRASRIVHDRMLRRMLSAPMTFFDRAAAGSVLNRFLQDLDSIDVSVPNSILDQLNKTLNIVTRLSLIYTQAPLILLSLPILVIPYIQVFRNVRISNRDCKRIEATGHAPVYSHFGEVLVGRQTIQAFGLESAFVARNLQLVETMALGKYGNQAVGKWAQATLSQWSCALFLVSGIVCVWLSSRGQMTGAQVGLVLMYAAALNSDLTSYSVSSAILESQFVSVERVAEYMRLPQEDYASETQHSHRQDSESWPTHGTISIRSVHLRYGYHLLPALRGIELEIPAKAKVALCGRTGCGKSSLFGVLSGLYSTHEGNIVIDGINIQEVPLSLLRRSLSVVSQDVFLISGSIQENLACGIIVPEDALQTLSWHVLKLVGMDEQIASLGGLDYQVEDGGSNFSVGERQLLTLARALMPRNVALLNSSSRAQDIEWHPPPILLCDEATASVDLVADARIHDILLGLQSTVVMICHRLQYIQRFEYAVVLDEGRVVEFAPPKTLLAAIPRSRLAGLCVEAGVIGDMS